MRDACDVRPEGDGDIRRVDAGAGRTWISMGNEGLERGREVPGRFTLSGVGGEPGVLEASGCESAHEVGACGDAEVVSERVDAAAGGVEIAQEDRGSGCPRGGLVDEMTPEAGFAATFDLIRDVDGDEVEREWGRERGCEWCGWREVNVEAGVEEARGVEGGAVVDRLDGEARGDEDGVASGVARGVGVCVRGVGAGEVVLESGVGERRAELAASGVAEL